jgi:branched-chain amino acid transport system ATP-binding protein
MTVAPAPLFELDSVSASYSSYRALFGVSMSVAERGIVALLGSNGAGKSTLARVATGLVPATAGAVRLDGADITSLPAYQIARRGVAHVPEGRGLFSSLTVEENLTLGFRQKLGRKGVRAALERAFAAFPVLSERRRQMGGTLSGGQQRILSLARVLATSPRVLIVDELSLGLAPVVVDQVYEGLLTIRDTGCALIVVEQQVDRALAIADQAVLLAHGSVAWTGPAARASSAMEELLSGRQLLGDDDDAAGPPLSGGTNGSGAANGSGGANGAALTGTDTTT